MPLKVMMAAPEIGPFAKTGGLGDVLESLPQALERLGLALTLIMPAYHDVHERGFHPRETGIRLDIPLGGQRATGALLKLKTGDITGYFVRADEFFDRRYLYATPDSDYPDNAARFLFFCRAVLEAARRDTPAILHAPDWQAASAVTFLKTQPSLYPELARTKTVFTIHNLGYQGIFPASLWDLLNLDRRFFNLHQLEFYGNINLLKGGAVFADAVTTVSPTYAREIQTEPPGFGLDGLFRERAARLHGILNGIDYREWDSASDGKIAQTYSPADLAGKAACKAALQRTFRLPEDPQAPVIGMVTRLSAQKGLDLVAEGLPALLATGAQLVLLGSGEKYYHDLFTRVAESYRGRAGIRIDFDETLAHQVIAGSDLLLMPSRYEPCGLTQLYGLRYGTVPVVRAIGGLKDTVSEGAGGNGFTFAAYDTADMLAAVRRAVAAFHKAGWTALVRGGMSQDFSWGRSAQAYAELYRNLMTGK